MLSYWRGRIRQHVAPTFCFFVMSLHVVLEIVNSVQEEHLTYGLSN